MHFPAIFNTIADMKEEKNTAARKTAATAKPKAGIGEDGTFRAWDKAKTSDAKKTGKTEDKGFVP